MQRIIDKILNWLVWSKEISPSEIDIYRYALERLMVKFLPMVFILIFGIFYKEFLLTVLVSTVFLMLRKYSGGRHASTMIRCFALSILVICGLVMAACHIDNSLVMLLSIILCSIILIYLGPERKNGTLNEQIFLHCKKKLYFCIAGIIILYISLSIIELTKFAVGIVLTTAVVTICRIPYSYKKKTKISLQV
ncbi:MAG: accessory gene regulator B family protein [Wujia sp.]